MQPRESSKSSDYGIIIYFGAPILMFTRRYKVRTVVLNPPQKSFSTKAETEVYIHSYITHTSILGFWHLLKCRAYRRVVDVSSNLWIRIWAFFGIGEPQYPYSTLLERGVSMQWSACTVKRRYLLFLCIAYLTEYMKKPTETAVHLSCLFNPQVAAEEYDETVLLQPRT